MSYYQGDYYQGDYYQGDPFLGALIGMGATWLGKKLLGRGAKAAGTTAIARVGAGAATGIVTGAAGAMMIPPVIDIFKTGARMAAPFLGGQRPTLGRATMPAAIGGDCGCQTGFHPNKSIGRGKATMGMAPGTYCVRNRSMNVANSRALRRGLRRVVGFSKLASRVRKSVKYAAKSV